MIDLVEEATGIRVRETVPDTVTAQVWWSPAATLSAPTRLRATTGVVRFWVVASPSSPLVFSPQQETTPPVTKMCLVMGS